MTSTSVKNYFVTYCVVVVVVEAVVDGADGEDAGSVAASWMMIVRVEVATRPWLSVTT
jgi:hypothetical protein